MLPNVSVSPNRNKVPYDVQVYDVQVYDVYCLMVFIDVTTTLRTLGWYWLHPFCGIILLLYIISFS